MAEQAPSVESQISELLRVEEEGPESAQPEPQPEVANEESTQDSAPEDQTSEPEATEETNESSSEETADDVEELEIGSLNDLADHLGVDVADLYKIPIAVNTPEGKKEVSIGEWKDSIQSAEQLNAERAKLAEQTRQREEALKTFQESMQQHLAQTSAMVEMAEQELVREYQSVDWNELRQIDPAEFAAKQQEFGQRNYQIQQAKQNAQAQWQEAQQAQQRMIQESLPEQAQKLVELIPSWKDESTASAEKARVAEFLGKQGFTQDELSNLYDARAVALAYKAMKYDELVSTSHPKTKKRLKIGGKPVKPGTPQSKAEKKSQAETDKRIRLRKTGSVNDLAALLNSDEYLGES